jgi:hypothetical protein
MMEVIMLIIYHKRDKIILTIPILLNGIKFGLLKEFGIVIHYLNNGWKYLELIFNIQIYIIHFIFNPKIKKIKIK